MARKTAVESAVDEAPHVRVRMYRQGLGDCFLLTFPRGGGKPFHLLIDCGVILGTRQPDVIMARVARDVAEATGGRLDVLVATHEHWDHLSGFLQARDEWDRMEIGEIWLAWTEDPSSGLAAELRRDRRAKVAALRQALARMAPDSKLRLGVGEVLGFFGGEEALGAAGRSDTGAALEYLAGRPDARIRYLSPRQPPLVPGGVEGVRIYVLGPPEDAVLIRKSDPTKRGKEVYEKQFALSLEDTFFAAVARRAREERRTAAAEGRIPSEEEAALLDQIEEDADEMETENLSFPFDAHHRIPLPAAEAEAEASAEVEGAAGGERPETREKQEREKTPEQKAREFFQRYYVDGKDAPAWRRIDDDWLGVAGELALKLDADTNNTSLALAFELEESGRVLLFPGDAQVGNWLSWEGVSWPAGGNGGREVTARDLLRRTVLYKVGHHGSHNATLREKGLELMESPELVALVPVNREMAKKKRWAMPFPPLYARLLEKTRGRVVLADDDALPPKRDALSAAEWKEFEGRTTVTELYVEYAVPL